jgi:decaprenyl-phosphate phosphoribosyltransferase
MLRLVVRSSIRLAHIMPPLIRLMRPHQWVKNLFVLAPLFFTPEAMTPAKIGVSLIAVAVFCLLASTVYIINDYCDRDSDRLHPTKKTRPIASGEVSPAWALGAAATILVSTTIIAIGWLPGRFVAIAFAYVAVNLLYSLRLKHVSILDVMLVAAGFVMRVDAGAVAIDITPSVWIIVCTFLLALFIAIAKRRDDVVRELGTAHRKSLDGYNLRFIDASLSMVLGSLLVSYLIYTTEDTVIAKYGTDQLYLTVPFVAAGVLRYLQVTLVEERSGSPTEIALTDRFLIAAVAGWVATFALLIYG